MFRKVVLDSSLKKNHGEVLIATPIKLTRVLFFLLVFFVFSVWFLLSSEYSKKERVKGVVTLKGGVSTIYPPRPAIAKLLNINAGDKVYKGQPLVVLKNSMYQTSETIKGRKGELEIGAIEEQISELRVQLAETKLHYKITTEETKSLIVINNELLNELVEERSAVKDGISLVTKQKENISRLFEKGNASKSEVEMLVSKEYLLKQSLRKVNQRILNVEKELLVQKSSQEKAPVNLKRETSIIKGELAQLELLKLSIDEVWSMTLVSPIDGIIANLNIKDSERVDANTAILDISSDEQVFEVELYVPSKAMGGVYSGSEVIIKLDAYPFQEFGSLKGGIYGVANSINTKNAFNNIPEPSMYKVAVSLKEQDVTTYGEKVELRIGMAVEADIVLEKRTLWKWMLDPYRNIVGRI